MTAAAPSYKIAELNEHQSLVEEIRQLEDKFTRQLGYDVTLIAYAQTDAEEAIDASALPGADLGCRAGNDD